MDDDTGKGRALGLLLILATLVMVIVLFVDQRIKKDILAESAKLREEIARVRGGTASPAGQADRSPASTGDDGVVPVADDPPAPQATVADEPAVEAGKVDGIGRPPSRGGVNAGGTRIRPGELRPAVQSFAVA
jgi:hypothetical protein